LPCPALPYPVLPHPTLPYLPSASNHKHSALDPNAGDASIVSDQETSKFGGGAIHCKSKLEISDGVEFRRNFAIRGGALYLSHLGFSEMHGHVTFESNSAFVGDN